MIDVTLRCPSCGPVAPRVSWQITSNGMRHLRAECSSCGRWLKFLPQNPGWLALAPKEEAR